MEGLIVWGATAVIQLIESSGYIGIFGLMILEGTFFPLPSELIMPFAGYLVSQGTFSIWLVALAGAAGNVIGMSASYAVGRYLGIPFLQRYGKYIFVEEKDIKRPLKLFRKYGTLIVLITRLIPGIRGFISVPAGVAKINYIQFVIYVFIGSYIWSLLLAYIGFVAGEKWEVIGGYVSKFGIFFVVLGVAIVVWWIYSRIRKIKKAV